ncbi:MAG: dihydrolipoamide dehydrogenase [Alphaproteobacteria bacterium]|nr:dihydrolipoamide dehydrogenase [Alphaproteobacteria bacterium]
MAETLRPDLCVIGGGSGGLTVAAGAAQMGASVVLFERDRMGGECLNTGCVPSKALLAAAHAAESARRARAFGVSSPPTVDWAGVRTHIDQVISALAPHDSVERFEKLGVRVERQAARFTGPDEVEAADGTPVRARRFVIATGSEPLVPPIPGLATTGFHTNQTIFTLPEMPAHLLVLGGGPVGVELAQAFRRLGAQVTMVERATMLARSDPELVAVLRQRLLAEGVVLHEGARVEQASAKGGGVTLVARLPGGAAVELTGSHVLVAAGRRPRLDGLGLERAGVAFTPQGVTVDRGQRTSNRRVFAIGDAAGPPQFTHSAAHQAGIVLRRALLRLPARSETRAIPAVTYTDPELAEVGMSEAAARERHGRVTVLRWPFRENDRAQAERTTEGMVKLLVDRRGRVLGAGIVGARAGDLLLPWVMAVAQQQRVGRLAGLVVPYPTLGEAGKRAAGSYFTPYLFSAAMRWLVRLISWLG